ncbi:MAG: class I SAM-dependent methyltransferase [Deltaproteobacteria bacterium]|nr:class I SAM-dependent methyltransferase [Deltaproteobacteria bacterium]
MKLAKEEIKSLGLGITAGLAGTALVGLFSLFGAVSTNVAIPVFIGVAIVVGTAHYWKTLHMNSMHDELNQVKNRLSLLGDSITETQGLVQLSGLNQPYPMPFGGSWALTPDAAAILAREIAIRRPNTIVELGSGVSTIMVGRLLQQMGSGHLISLDHDPDWADETRRNILANGLQDYVEVLDAPLVKQQFNGKDFVWYQIPEQLRHIEQIDMLTVDGPPQTTDTTVLARYPALPAFTAQFSEHAVIYIDDAKRDTEQKMIEEWQQQYPGWKSKMIDTIPGTCLLER